MKLNRSLFAAPVVVLAVSSSAHAADDLVGDWTGQADLVFREDGTFTLGDMKGKWRRDGATLTLVDGDGDSATYKLSLTGTRLVLSGGDLGEPLAFERKAKKGPLGKALAKPQDAKPQEAKPADGIPDAQPLDAKPADPAPAGARPGDARPELSRPPQEALKDVKKVTPKFKSKTVEIKDPEGKYTVTVPTTWTFQTGQEANARYSIVNPGYTGMDTVKHSIVYWQLPVLPSEANKGFKDRCEDGARKLEQTYPTFKRGSTEVLEAPSGLIGKTTFTGSITNAYGQNQAAVGLVLVRQVKHYYLAVTVVSLKEVAGEHDDDILAALDATVLVVKDRDPEAERQLVGGWVSALKTKGTALETYQFNADGTFQWDFESSFSVTVKDPSTGDTRATAGGASVDHERGRYEVRGDTIYFVSNKGEQGSFFKIWNEGGKTHLQVGNGKFVR